MSLPPIEFDIIANVTQRDIDKGIRYDCDNCPLARAIERKLRKYGLNNVAVLSSYYIYISRNKGLPYSATIRANEDVGRFIRLFDTGQEVTPGKFKLHFSRNAHSL